MNAQKPAQDGTTPGQAAYEAYAMAAPDDLNFREPDDLDDWERDAWEAAAQAGYEQRARNDAIAAQPQPAPGPHRVQAQAVPGNLVRHEDHDPSVICRPGGYGLCETWPPEQPAPELAAAMAETHAVRDGYARLCEEFSDSPQSGQSARISLTVLNRHRKAAGLKPRRPAPAGEHRDPFMQATEERDRLRELLDEIGVMAANAPEDGDSFELLEEIAMRIAAHDAGLPS